MAYGEVKNQKIATILKYIFNLRPVFKELTRSLIRYNVRIPKNKPGFYPRRLNIRSDISVLKVDNFNL
ncbi:hypothetical protein LCDVSa156L [Lymphocystis disease virus 3]|uniref:Uncharacterized protein n=1 Tax=Lymphocystis disease virus 3 TaxID=2560566 RepID=A0A1B2RW52_9VIRU|nr:hypothetical protein BZK12_gp156 [Lymphocystis disease virus Sa]AOC55240.1 hypothetical protein LCDVSa156L [Lymphocystis disease virus 3]